MKYTKEKTDEICKYVRAGNLYKDAAMLVGISKETYYQWKERYPDFSEALKKAEAECLARNIALVLRAGEKTWQAAAWWLERTYKERFALRSEFTGPNGENITVNILARYAPPQQLKTVEKKPLSNKKTLLTAPNFAP